MAKEEGKTVTLKSSDGEVFEVEEAVAKESQTISHMIEDGCADSGIPLPNVTSKILAKVIEYCKKHVDAQKSADDKIQEEELKAWDAEFVKVDQATLFDLILVCSRGHCLDSRGHNAQRTSYTITSSSPRKLEPWGCRDTV